MAKVFPDGWREMEATGGAARELQTLGQLAAGLDDTYTVYHGVHWTRVVRNDVLGTWTRIREVGDRGCILLRPDRVVAWRSIGLRPDPVADLEAVMVEILGQRKSRDRTSTGWSGASNEASA